MEKFEKALEGLPQNFIVGIVMPSESYDNANLRLLDFLVNKKKASGGYISISKPYSHTVNMLEEAGIKTENFHFIDCLTKSVGGDITEAKNCAWVQSPAHLTELSIAVHNFFTSSEEKNRFLYLDSISSLCIHNPVGSVLKFVHYLTGKIRVFGINGVMLSLHEDDDKRLISSLSQFCDRVIRV